MLHMKYQGTNYIIKKKYKGSSNGVDIDRTSPFGNPFFLEKEEDREQVVLKYQKYLVDKIIKGQDNEVKALIRLRAKFAKPLQLNCHCAPRLCHGDALAQTADSFEQYWVNNNHSIIIAGSRDFKDYNLLERVTDNFIEDNNISSPEIVSGAARGADTLGEQYAKNKKIPLVKFPADWNRFKKSAGFKRNLLMAYYSHSAIIFWDGESKGTKNMIDLAEIYNLNTKIEIINW